MKDSIYKLQKRVEQYSTEATVYQEGSDRINIEIPGVSDANAILEELGKPGSLEFQDAETIDVRGKLLFPGFIDAHTHMAAKFNTPFLCYGENVSFEYGGNADVETYSAKDQIENGVAVGFPKEELLGYGVSENDLILTEAPSAEELARLDPFYMSYFVPWNSYKNYQIAKEHGFHDLTHEWDRTHHAENFDQIDSRAYLVHSWLKYPKFGHAAATDYTARYIRYGMMTREEAIPIIKERDGALDPLCVRDFCAFCGYTETEFWAIMDKFYNRDLFEKDEYGRWMLKEPIWKEN